MTAPAARPRLEGLSGEPCPYLTIQETTVRLRCSTKAVRRYVGSGKLVAYRVGRRIAVVKLGTHIRIDSDDLAHDAASRQETAPRS
jgi:excisionase family DNA binding protein